VVRSLAKGACGEHGQVEEIYDLRIKAVQDNGVEIREMLLDAEMTHQLTGRYLIVKKITLVTIELNVAKIEAAVDAV
jgi:replication factor A1